MKSCDENPAHLTFMKRDLQNIFRVQRNAQIQRGQQMSKIIDPSKAVTITVTIDPIGNATFKSSRPISAIEVIGHFITLISENVRMILDQTKGLIGVKEESLFTIRVIGYLAGCIMVNVDAMRNAPKMEIKTETKPPVTQ